MSSHIRNILISHIPDKLYLRYQYFKHFKRWLNFKHPKRFTEKIQWLKIYNRNDLYTRLVDKFDVRSYVANIIGENYLIPLLGVWDDPSQINFDTLPNQFVLKTTHDSGGVFVCKDKQSINIDNVRDWLRNRLSLKVYPVTREWPYKNVQPRIICEKFMSNSIGDDLTDYKWYCFNGEPTYCQVIRDRRTNETIDFFDCEWNHLDLIAMNPHATNSQVKISKPKNLELMIEIARKLAVDKPFVRVDLYEIYEHEYFGELTFFPNSGFGSIRPDEWDLTLGNLLNLKAIRGGG